MKPCKTYSFLWGLRVSGEFERKYPRASTIFRQITNHGENYTAWLLCHHQAKWNRYKKIIRFIDEFDRACDSDPAGVMCPITKHLCSYIEDQLLEKRLYPMDST